MTEPDAGRPGPLPLKEIDGIIGRMGDISLTIEDVVLLVLRAVPRPVKGLERLTGEVLLALREVLDGPDVEPAVFERGPGGPRSEDVELALDGLAFSNSVKTTGGDGRDAGATQFEIAPRGRTRIKEKWDALPAVTRQALLQRRAEWDAAPPVAMAEPTYVHNEALLRAGPRAAPPGGQDGCRAAERPPARGGADAARRQRYMDRGDRFINEKKYDEAYAAYTIASKYGAPDAVLQLKMIWCLSELDLYNNGLKHCRAAIRADPARADGYVAMAHCLHRLGRHAKALPYARRAVQHGPSDTQPYMLSGAILNHLDRHAEALSHYQRAVRLDPGNVNARQNASFSLFRLERYEEALRQVEKVAEMTPGDPVAHARIVTCLSRMGRHEEAIPAGRRAIEAAPDSVDSYFPLITSLIGLGRHGEVLEWCGRAAKANALDPRPSFTMALSLRALGRLEEALSYCQRAVELDPDSTDFRTLMSQLLRDLGRLGEALSHCETVVLAEPDNLPVLSNMGSMLADVGRHKEALACFGRALRIDPTQPTPRYNRALSLQTTGQLGKALREYKRAVKLDPGNTGAYNNMGTVLSSLGRDGEALAHFDRALELSPGNAAAHHNKAISLQNLSLHTEALAHFDRALELSPGNAAARVGRISCLDDLGLPDKAVGRYAGDALGPAAPPGAAAHGAPGRYAAPPGAAVAGHTGTRPAAPPGAASDDGRVHRVKSLLPMDESEVLEFKSWLSSRQAAHAGSNKMEDKIARELCSFVNTRGGDLLIGVGDGGKVEGLAPGGARLSRQERDRMLTWLTNVIVGYFGAEHDRHFDREIVEVDGLDILHCIITESKDGPVPLSKRLEGKYDFFVRAGSTCRPLNSRETIEYVKTKWLSRPQPMGQSEPDRAKEIASALKSQMHASLGEGL